MSDVEPPTEAPDEAATSAPVEPEPEAPRDEAREALLAAFTTELGDAVVDHVIRPGDDLVIRVSTEGWAAAAEAARRKLGFGYFCFLSAIDWRPSPFGRYEDADVDVPIQGKLDEPYEIVRGDTGGETRFQVFARVRDVRDGRELSLRADVPDDTLTVGSWVRSYAGADWHERETWEMFGIQFAGHPGLRHIYLPVDFEGHPLRKDFPLLARVVKPWPGIVDVEPMPGEAASDDSETEEASA